MVLRIHLLGAPRVVADGSAAPAPRGIKAWALLTYLLLRDGPAPRAEVARLLFPHALDPLAALRWNLTVVRDLVGDRNAWRGDPMTWAPAVPPVVDVLMLHAEPGALSDGDLGSALGHDLLEGLAFTLLPAFEIWLQAQRRRARGAAAAWLEEAALARLARGDADGAAGLATRLMASDPAAADHRALARVIAAARPGGTGTVVRPTPEDVELEDAWTLHRAVSRSGTDAEAVPAMLALARAAVRRAHYARAESWLVRAGAAAAAPEEWAALLVLRGTVRTDTADYPAALADLAEAGQIGGDVRRRSHALALTGRVHLLRGDLDDAADALDQALLTVRDGWPELPGTEALRAHVDLYRGRAAIAHPRLEGAFALATRTGGLAAGGLAARGLGLVLAAQGNVIGAVTTLKDAVRRAGRRPGRWLWAQLWILEALADVGARYGLGATPVWAGELARRAARGGMPELVARAALHDARLGDPDSLVAARCLAVGIENPSLQGLLQAG